MANLLPCHQSCTEDLLKEVRALAHGHFQDAITVDSIDFQQTESAQPNFAYHTMSGDGAAGTFSHRFLFTVVAPCPQANSLNSIQEMLESDQFNESLLSNETIASSTESITDGNHQDGGISNQLAETQVDSSVDLSFLGNMDVGVWENDTEQSSLDWLQSNDSDALDDTAVLLYSLDTDEAFQTIGEEIEVEATSAIDRASGQDVVMTCVTDNVPMGQTANEDQTSVSSTTVIINELASLSLQQQPHLQQSNEISSSTWDNFVHSDQSSNGIPQPNYYANLDLGSLTGFTSSDGLSVGMPSHGQQFMCPANLPAVSAFMNGGNNGGLSIKWPSSQSGLPMSANNKASHGRVAKQARSKKSGNSRRPSMLLPKPSIPYSQKKLPSVTKPEIPRARKTSPTQIHSPTSTVTQPAPNRFIDTVEPGVPEGHTCATWIILEGLTKPRQQRKQDKKAARGYLDGNGKSPLEPTEIDSVPISPVAGKQAMIYTCPLCGKEYNSANGLKYHARKGHGPKSIYKCEICNKEYKSRHGMRAHIKSHLIREAAEKMLRQQ